VAAGAQHVLYTSHMGADATSPFPPMITHAATEEILRGCGAPSTTALRHGFYAATVPRLVAGALATGELRAPEDGPVAWDRARGPRGGRRRGPDVRGAR
jgi:NAD(P)H dehydrogenase (quinone)